jgi:hypothetical protein
MGNELLFIFLSVVMPCVMQAMAARMAGRQSILGMARS